MNDAHAAIAALYEAEHGQILAFLVRLVRTPEAAEDLCQDTFIKALLAWPERDPAGNVFAWLYAIARHTAIDYLRGQRYRQALPLDTLPAGDALVSSCEEHIVDAAPVHQALAQVPAAQRVPLILQAFADAPVHDIARRLGCTPTNVHVRLHRGRTRFRTAFAAISS